jgi:hypothetical protein
MVDDVDIHEKEDDEYANGEYKIHQYICLPIICD